MEGRMDDGILPSVIMDLNKATKNLRVVKCAKSDDDLTVTTLLGDTQLTYKIIGALAGNGKLLGSHATMLWLGFVPIEGKLQTMFTSTTQSTSLEQHMLEWCHLCETRHYYLWLTLDTNCTHPSRRGRPGDLK